MPRSQENALSSNIGTQNLSNSATLSLTHSDNSSLSSYSSSIADSTLTRTSSLSRTVKQILNRKRSQSLNYTEPINSSDTTSTSSQNSSSTSTKLKLLSKRSVSSVFPASLIMNPLTTSPNTSTRDNSISSLSDMELEFPIQPLSRIEEDNIGINGKYSSATNTVKLQTKLSMAKAQIKESDIKIYDEIADNILNKISKVDDSIDWRI